MRRIRRKRALRDSGIWPESRKFDTWLVSVGSDVLISRASMVAHGFLAGLLRQGDLRVQSDGSHNAGQRAIAEYARAIRLRQAWGIPVPRDACVHQLIDAVEAETALKALGVRPDVIIHVRRYTPRAFGHAPRTDYVGEIPHDIDPDDKAALVTAIRRRFGSGTYKLSWRGPHPTEDRPGYFFLHATDLRVQPGSGHQQ